ncbi:hypothetical protein FACS1894184_02250 [Clostridia bacterium]|nr:hypothetical protein FACS1894184_02250 [Clostridia bacterium]
MGQTSKLNGILHYVKAQPSKHRSQARINAMCIMMEGLFSTLGHDIVGVTTIIPLFMADLGISMGVIGGMSTVRYVCSGVMPLLAGGPVAAARSKRNLSIIINSIGRGSILLIPLMLAVGLPKELFIMLFIGIMVLFHICQPVTGISWNYLLGSCVPADQRGKLLGTLFGISGLISFMSSAIIKAIRSSPHLALMDQYKWILFLGGTLMVMSVLCYIPLRESETVVSAKEERSVKAYLLALAGCFQSREYNWAIAANACSSVSMAVTTFLFVFAQNQLGLSGANVSNLLIIQTAGIMVGGFLNGRVSARFGIKRMLLAAESAALFVPIFCLISLNLVSGNSPSGNLPLICAGAAVCLMGFARGGMIGYQAYILEVMDPRRTIYGIVAKGIALLPFSFVSLIIGSFLETHSYRPVFIFQIAAALLALFCVNRLKLIVYTKKDKPAE